MIKRQPFLKVCGIVLALSIVSYLGFSNNRITSFKNTNNIKYASASQNSPIVVVPHTTQAASKPAGTASDTKKATSSQTLHTQKSDNLSTKPKIPPVKKETSKTLHTSPTKSIGEPSGVIFVNAIIKPMDYELNQRFWNWRVNDLVRITDNVNHMQEGILEVTRKAAIILAERLSRTGSTASFDPDLEEAMNWFMISAKQYWFPSAENKYNDALDDLKKYINRLKSRQASFYTRADNLIPMLEDFEDLLGSCDENLVKKKEADGTYVKFTRADNYFYYAKGVATAMLPILKAIKIEFKRTIESSHAMELLDDAIVSLEKAGQIEPIIILNNDLSSIFANHRANMAAPISHARFYVGLLINAIRLS